MYNVLCRLILVGEKCDRTVRMYKNICWTIRQATGRDWTWKRVAAYRRTLCTTLVRQVESEEAAAQEALLRQFAQMPAERIRNFSIIAHVDHGKSTLADRLLELTGAISRQAGQNQVLDNLQVERERGITVKAQTASIFHKYQNELYLLNLIDTPGHVDFSNEVGWARECHNKLKLIPPLHPAAGLTLAGGLRWCHSACGRLSWCPGADCGQLSSCQATRAGRGAGAQQDRHQARPTRPGDQRYEATLRY